MEARSSPAEPVDCHGVCPATVAASDRHLADGGDRAKRLRTDATRGERPSPIPCSVARHRPVPEPGRRHFTGWTVQAVP